MRARNDQTSLHDMLAHAQEAAELLGDRSREALRRGRVLQLALTRLVEVIGEAAYRVSDEKRQQRYVETKVPGTFFPVRTRLLGR